jgi:4-amino-4-deoxychorismate lyase
LPHNLLETIKINNKRIENIKYHNQRFNLSKKELFGCDKIIDLYDYITPPDDKLYRCRVVYNCDILKVEYIPYIPRVQKRFIIKESDIDYRYKYENRDSLNALIKNNTKYDDVIISKDNLLTDTTIANIAFFDGKSWITPKKPLLYGTMREKLLENNFLIPKDIKIDDIEKFYGFALMNAMIGFQIIDKVKIRINDVRRDISI